MDDSVPFLVAKADMPVDDDQPHAETTTEVREEDPPSWGIFHTRCGHPRRRDD